MGGSIGTPKSLNECDFNYGTSLYSKLCSPSYWRAVLLDPRLPKGEYPLRFILTIRNGFYCSLEISLTRERFTCSRAWNRTDLSQIQSNFFWTVADRFGTLFFYSMRFLAMGHVTRNMFKRCKQTRCQKNIFFYFFCFCAIIFYSYPIVLFLLYFVVNRTVPNRSVSNGYCILDQNSTVHWTEPLKKSETDIRL